MTIKELLQFIKDEDERLKARYKTGGKSHHEKRSLARTVKLAEELGELCEEILAANGDQRQEKLDKIEKGNLGEEFANVLITTLLLAKEMDVDVELALKEKIKKIEKRYLK